ncbi:hypothetical protein FJZ19_05355 [Candidatus Pacearchaeota archaeon]|nr:hypothetical protein [Candidatus Pacearchaeota archaeon]
MLKWFESNNGRDLGWVLLILGGIFFIILFFVMLPLNEVIYQLIISGLAFLFGLFILLVPFIKKLLR